MMSGKVQTRYLKEKYEYFCFPVLHLFSPSKIVNSFKTWISHQLKEIYEFFCFPVDPVEISSWLHIIWNQMVRVNWQKKLRNIHPVGGDLKKVATCNLYTLQAGKQKTEYEARCSGLPKGNQIPLIARVWGTPNWGLDVKVKKTWSKFAGGEGLNVAALAARARVRGAAADQEHWRIQLGSWVYSCTSKNSCQKK